MKNQAAETATVLKVKGGEATIITNKSKACKECAKARAGICGKGGAGMVIKVRNQIGAQNGDTVEIGLDTKTHMTGYLVVFVLPIFALLLGTYTGHVLSGAYGINNLDVITGLTGLVGSIIYSIITVYKLDKSVQMHITKILHGASEYGVGSYPEEIDYLHAFGRRND